MFRRTLMALCTFKCTFVAAAWFCIWSAGIDTNAYSYQIRHPSSFCRHEPWQYWTHKTPKGNLGSQVWVLRLFQGLMCWPLKFRCLKHHELSAQEPRLVSYAGTCFCSFASGLDSSSSSLWAVTRGKSISLIVWYLLRLLVSFLFAVLRVYCSSSMIAIGISGVVAALCLQCCAFFYFG